MSIGQIPRAPLEDWFRDRYFTASVDISSSGVENYALGELREILGITTRELDETVFRDSPSVGAPALRAAVAARYAPGRSENVVVTHGSSEAIFLATAALVRPGDEVVVPGPGYHALVSTVTALGGRPRVWDLGSGEGFAADLDRLRDLLGTRVRAVIVNFPHNPTGVTLDRSAYGEFVELIARSGAYLLWDGAFTDLVYDAPPLPDPFLTVERCVSFGTLSKSYGLPGLRVGWAFAPRHVIADMVRLRDYLTIATSPLTESVATAAVLNADVLIGPRRAQAKANREFLTRWAHDHPDLVRCPVPGGGVTAFPRVIGVPNVTDMCAALAEDRGVLVVPGSCFGVPDRIRVGFGGPADEFAKGLTALSETVVKTTTGGVWA